VSCVLRFWSTYGVRVFADVPWVRFFTLLGTSKTLSVGGVGGHKTLIFTANMSKFHIILRG
jgi:hypothetical protein